MRDPLGQARAECPAQVVTIDGPDAVAFAHAQFSSDVAALAVGQWQFSAWLDAAGRVRAFFHLARPAESALLLLLRGRDAATVAGELARFVFRSKVKIAANATSALATGAALPLQAVRTTPLGLALGCGGHALELRSGADGDEAWYPEQLSAGWPWLPPDAEGRWLAPALSLERLGATVLGKGCYPGQEIIARIHFRGRVKRQLCRVALPRLPEAGTPLAGRILGPIVALGDHVQALAVLDDATKDVQTAGRPLVENGQDGLEVLCRWPA